MSQGQTAYNVDAAIAVPGLLGPGNEGRDIITLVAFEAIPFGRFVRLRADGMAELPKDDSLPMLGVSVFVDTLMGSYPQGSPAINAGDTFAVLRRGRIWVAYDGNGVPSALGGMLVSNDNITPVVANFGMATAAAALANKVRDASTYAKFFSTAGNASGLALAEISLA